MQDSALRERATRLTYPLTAVQYSMLADGLRAPREGVNFQQLICTFHEGLNVSQLRDGWQRLLERHAVLRTSFQVDDCDQVQAVHPRIDWDLGETDWTAIGIPEGEKRLAAWLRDDRRRGFALDHPPL